MEQMRIILQLQDIINEKAFLKKSNELGSKAKELKVLQESIRKVEEEYQTVEAGILSVEEKTKNLEIQTEKLAQQANSSKDRLYGAKGGSLKELLSLQQAIQKIEQDVEKSEALYWDTFKQIEQLKEKRKKLREMIKALKLQYNEGVKIYKSEKNNMELKLAEITIKEEELREKLGPEVLKKFTDTEKRFPLNPVAIMKGGICTGCRISVPSVLALKIREGKNLYRCDSCGRLLILE